MYLILQIHIEHTMFPGLFETLYIYLLNKPNNKPEEIAFIIHCKLSVID